MSMLSAATFREAADLLVDAVAPARCIGCLREGSWHCAACKNQWRVHDLSCVVCRAPVRDGVTCLGCRSDTPLQGLVTAGSYKTERLRRGIDWLKFSSVQAVAQPLAWLVVSQLRHIAPLSTLQERGILVPIPLHARRLHQRGFNQAEEITKSLSELLAIPWSAALLRVKHTYRQTSLPMAERAGNVADAFVLHEGKLDTLKGKDFLLVVDDVTTSGSTLSAAAALLRAKRQQVWGVVIARG